MKFSGLCEWIGGLFLKITPLARASKNLGIKHSQLNLKRAGPKLWVSPLDGVSKRIEDAVLDTYTLDGWKGSSAEGGLLLNLIKSLSFHTLPNHYRATFVEAIYSGNVQQRFMVSLSDLLAQVALSDKDSMCRNVDFMFSQHEVIEDWGDGITFKNNMSALHFFPTIESWMFADLLRSAGSELILQIAKTSEIPKCLSWM